MESNQNEKQVNAMPFIGTKAPAFKAKTAEPAISNTDSSLDVY